MKGGEKEFFLFSLLDDSKTLFDDLMSKSSRFNEQKETARYDR